MGTVEVVAIIVLVAAAVFGIVTLVGTSRRNMGKRENDLRADGIAAAAESGKEEAAKELPEEELVAVIAASIQAYGARDPHCSLRVKSYRRVPTTSPLWNTVSRKEYLSNKL